MALTALIALILMIAVPVDAAAGIAILPLLVLLVTARWPTRLWAVAAASLMLVYFSYGVMEILTDPASRTRAMLFSVLTLTVFFGALDSIRRR